MKILVAVVCGMTLAISAQAQDKKKEPSEKQKAQQERMKDCNAKMGEKKGDERKAFMKTCLSAKKDTQQDKMKSCNADAKGKTGDERKAFMKECLSK